MNKIVVVLCLLLGLCGCTQPADPVVVDPHSSIYSENYTVEEVIAAFDEVVLASEYSSGDGNPALVQKWDGPIYCKITGYRDSDLVILENLFNELNAVEGFPGIYQGEHYYQVTIDFYANDDEFLDHMGHIAGINVDGAVEYWYDTELNFIYEGSIGYKDKMDEDIRKSVLIEEVINMLGITDTETREDSITYQYSSTNMELSEMDWIIVKLLYNEEIKTSMNAEECHEIIKKLYY